MVKLQIQGRYIEQFGFCVWGSFQRKVDNTELPHLAGLECFGSLREKPVFVSLETSVSTDFLAVNAQAANGTRKRSTLGENG